MRERKNMFEIAKEIFSAIKKNNNGEGFTIYRISRETGINNVSVKNWIKLIEQIQNERDIIVLKAKTKVGESMMVGIEGR